MIDRKRDFWVLLINYFDVIITYIKKAAMRVLFLRLLFSFKILYN